MRSLVTLTFLCPSTQQALEYKIEVDAHILVKRWSKTLKCRCPHCKSVHSFSFRRGYVDAVISQIGRIEREGASSLLGL